MAQAARLNFRMQKELKLLLTDPPPAASFPLLYPDSDLSSFYLSSIDAQIEGPEGTVYAKGVFTIKIQIPERYPFQPPIVTFATPIYHPNIDNGGRICLDILNLPPKGTWQPSLNISAVLTCIGLLLSEPNPDDGLMCEASREYKYNRQAFDQKAQSMTEKYARAGASEDHGCSQSRQIISNSSMMEPKGSDTLKHEVNEDFVSDKKLCGISRKLSFESSGPSQKRESDTRVNEENIAHVSKSQMEVKGPEQESNKESTECYQNHEKLQRNRRKLSLASLSPSQMKNVDEKENVVANQCSSILNPQSISVSYAESRPALQYSNYHEQQSHQEHFFNSMSESKSTSSKKLLCPVREQLLESSRSRQRSHDNGEKMCTLPKSLSSHVNVSDETLPIHHAVSHNEMQNPMYLNDRTASGLKNVGRKKLGLAGRKLSLRPLASSQNQEEDNKEKMAANKGLMVAHPYSLSTASSMSSLVSKISEYNEGEAGSCATNVDSKKLFGIRGKLPLEPLCQLQVGNNGGNQMPTLQSEKPSAKSSKSMLLLQDCRYDGKQQPKQDHDEKFAGGIEQQEGGSLASETVIVLDSEDSEGETDGSSRSRLSLARKRLPGKRKAKV
ncbi:unnamed protein product [Ilex paraguariensis]|uniref:E2 ubiquitin-conjugating enzyme n=1 Tax=Ilex paraguariensis TaxID=185542 RepID=A0ABC8U883_9AQUA